MMYHFWGKGCNYKKCDREIFANVGTFRNTDFVSVCAKHLPKAVRKLSGKDRRMVKVQIR